MLCMLGVHMQVLYMRNLVTMHITYTGKTHLNAF